jgi:hypothetical protein
MPSMTRVAESRPTIWTEPSGSQSGPLDGRRDQAAGGGEHRDQQGPQPLGNAVRGVAVWMGAKPRA